MEETGWVVAGLGAVAAALAIVGFVAVLRALRLRRRGIETQATVVEYVDRGDVGEVSEHPRVRFVAEDGQVIDAVRGTAHAERRYTVGGTVAVRYDPRQPHRFALERESTMLLPAIMFASALALTAVAVGLAILAP